MNYRTSKYPKCIFPILLFVLALSLTLSGCSDEPRNASSLIGPRKTAPEINATANRQIEIIVNSDKELYEVDETALFTVEVYKNGALLPEVNNILIEATFPDELTVVSLNPVLPGIFSYEALLTSEGQKTLTVTARLDNQHAIAALEEQILRLEIKIANLESVLIGETDPIKQNILQRSIDRCEGMIERFEFRIAVFHEPDATGAKTITVEEIGSPVILQWMNIMNGCSCHGNHLTSDTLGEAKLSIFPYMCVPISEANLYFVSRDPLGTPLDETKTLQELGLTVNNTMLFVGPQWW